MAETITCICFFITAVWFVITLIIDECKSRKQKAASLERMKHHYETIEKVQHKYQIDKCTYLLNAFTINEMRELNGLKPFPAKKDEHLYNCPNCGAPITGDKCEYCGTVFRDRSEDTVTCYADNRPVLTLRNDIRILDDRITTEEMNANLIRALHADRF